MEPPHPLDQNLRSKEMPPWIHLLPCLYKYALLLPSSSSSPFLQGIDQPSAVDIGFLHHHNSLPFEKGGNEEDEGDQAGGITKMEPPNNVTHADLPFCSMPFVLTPSYKSLWVYTTPLDATVPVLITQIVLVNICIRLILVILRPLKQTRFVAEIISGILVGPFVLGRFIDDRSQFTYHDVYPRCMRMMEATANLALVYGMFLKGLEINLISIGNVETKARHVGFVGAIFPFVVGAGICYILDLAMTDGMLICGTALAVTSYSVTSRILADLKLLHTDMGQRALASASVSNMTSWVLVCITMGITGRNDKTPWVLLSFIAFVLAAVYGVRPILKRLFKIFPMEDYEDSHIGFGVAMAAFFGFLTDALGMYAFTGAFIFGLIVPSGDFGTAMTQKLEDLVVKILLPLYSVVIGVKMDFSIWSNVSEGDEIKILICVAAACLAKVGSTIFVALFHKMTLKETMGLGFLLNTKGVLAIVVLNAGYEREVLDDRVFQAMVGSMAIMTAMGPLVANSVFRPSKAISTYKNRTIQSGDKEEPEFRILACVHDSQDIPGVISLLELSNAPNRSPVHAFVLHLIEIISRASALLIVHKSRKSRVGRTHQQQSDMIVHALKSYEEETSGNIMVQSLTAMSPYDTMEEDIGGLAIDKQVSLIVIPFHKHKDPTGRRLEESNLAVRDLNRRIQSHSPCSVAILVDRGLGNLPSLECSNDIRRVAMIYMGGKDDREALFYAWRMASHQAVALDVIRFISDESEIEKAELPEEQFGILEAVSEYDKQKKLDQEFLQSFREKTFDVMSITYTEVMASNSEHMLAWLNEVDNHYDLYVVGREEKSVNPLTMPLVDWAEYPELGPIGDTLLMSDFASTVSILVVKQFYDETRKEEIPKMRNKMMQHAFNYDV